MKPKQLFAPCAGSRLGAHALPNGQPAADQPPPEAATARVRSSELLRGRRCLVIEHEGAEYRLQATRLGKLILTK